MTLARTLGKTGLRVSPIGLGLAALGRPGYINLGHAEDIGADHDIDIMQAHALKVLDTALSYGVHYFDAARSYGLSEAFLSHWLKEKQMLASEVTIGSKWGYIYTAGWQTEAQIHERKDHSLVTLKKQWAESDTLLGPHLNLYQIHSATLKTGVLENNAILERLAALKRSGVHIGLSLSGPQQAATLERALKVRIDGERLFATVQATFNALEPSAAPMLATAHAQGLGVIIKEALANGRLSERNTNLDFSPKLESLREQSSRFGIGIDALCLAYILQQPWVDTVLSGAASSVQLESNMDALGITLDEEANAILKSLRETPEYYWGVRAGLSWN